jgi:hypothetical protein
LSLRHSQFHIACLTSTIVIFCPISQNWAEDSVLKPSGPILAFIESAFLNRLEKYETTATLMSIGEVQMTPPRLICVVLFLLLLILVAK